MKKIKKNYHRATPQMIHDFNNDISVVENFFNYCSENMFEDDVRKLFLNAKKTVRDMSKKMCTDRDTEWIQKMKSTRSAQKCN